MHQNSKMKSLIFVFWNEQIVNFDTYTERKHIEAPKNKIISNVTIVGLEGILTR